MDLSIGLPSGLPSTSGPELVEWARRADARGFSSLGTLDRPTAGGSESLVALVAAAAVTERIGLCTSILLGPRRPEVAGLAKQALSLQAVAPGRVTLGIGLDASDDEASHFVQGNGGYRLEEMLAQVREIWGAYEIGSSAGAIPDLVIGGHVDGSLERAARVVDGWIAVDISPDAYASMVERLEAAWVEAGRRGSPRKLALTHFSLSDDPQDVETVQARVRAFEGAGCEELILFPDSSDPAQVDLLADAAGL